LSHIQHPEFPEVRESGEFFLRESNLRHNLPRAYLIISDSDTLTNLLIRNYGVMSERILSVPFLPSPFLSKVNKKADKTVIEEYKLVEPYFYYPAQLWAHKNHIRIFEAIKILRDSFNTKINLVLTGVDHGNFKHLDNSLRKKDLIDQVTYLGFLESSKIEKIYQNAYCIILPTYFGPTNIPPLESALFIDPDDVNSLVNAMLHVMDQKTRDKLIYNGQIALSNHLLNVDEQKKKLLSEIRKYENRLSTWK
jgi:glycosyltransferase involved in cell wall biosynthesis